MPRLIDHLLRSIPWGLVGMAALVVAVERWAAAHWLDIAPIEAAHYRFARHAADHEARDSAILFFGDSQVKEGLLPSVVEARTGRRAYNLAVQASPAPFSYLLFRRALRAGARPAAVVVDFNGPLLQVDTAGKLRELAALAGLGDCLEMAWGLRRADLVPLWALARYVPTFQNRDEVRAGVLASLAGRGASYRAKLLAALRNWRVNRGAFVLPKYPAAARPSGAPVDELMVNPHWSCHPLNLAYARRFLALAEAEKVPVYLVVMPYSPAVRRIREARGLEAAYDRTFLAEALRFPGVTVLDGRAMDVDPNDFADGTHFDRDGAFAFSHALTDHLPTASPSTRPPKLVRLGPARVLPPRPPIEDFAQSGIALSPPATLKR